MWAPSRFLHPALWALGTWRWFCRGLEKSSATLVKIQGRRQCRCKEAAKQVPHLLLAPLLLDQLLAVTPFTCSPVVFRGLTPNTTR